MSLAPLAGPWALVLVLASYRLTRLWVDDVLPPIPRIRNAITDWADARDDRRLRAAIAADRLDPEWQAEADEAGKRALRGGYNAPSVIGSQEQAEQARRHRHGNMPVLAYLTTCYWCSGFWIALAVVLVAVLLPVTWWAIPASALAFSAVTGLLSQLAK